MANLKLSIAVAVICVLFQCVDSRSVLTSLREKGLSKGSKFGGKFDGLKNVSAKSLGGVFLPTVNVSGFEDKTTLPVEIDKIKPSNRKPIFGGKLGKLDSLKEKLNNIASLKKSIWKKKLAKIGNAKPILSKVKLGNFSSGRKFSKKLNLNIGKLGKGKFSKLGSKNRSIGYNLNSVFRRRLLPTSKLTLDGKIVSKGRRFDVTGLFEKTLRQRLADKLGVGNRFNFFDGRRGIFDRTGRIFGKSKKLNLLDMIDAKLASLNSRFQRTINGINKKAGRLNLTPLELTEKFDGKMANVNGKTPSIGEKLGEFNRKLSVDIGNIYPEKLTIKFNPKDKLDGNLSSVSSNGLFNGGGRIFKNSKLGIDLNPLDILEGKLWFLKSKLNLGKKLRLQPLFDGKLFTKKASKLNPIDFFDGKLAKVKFGNKNLIDQLDSKLAIFESKFQKPVSLGWNGKLDDILPTLEGKMADVKGKVDSIVGKIRHLKNDSGETRFQRLWKREGSGKVANMLAAKFALKKRLFERISRLGRRESKFGAKFVQKLKARRAAKIADTKLSGKYPPTGKIRKITADKLFKKRASATTTAAPIVTTTTSVAPTASTVSLTVSSLLEKVSNISSSGGVSSDTVRNSEMFDSIPGANGILYAVNLLENGGSLKDAAAALVERNDVDALKHLFDSINKASLASANL